MITWSTIFGYKKYLFKEDKNDFGHIINGPKPRYWYSEKHGWHDADYCAGLIISYHSKKLFFMNQAVAIKINDIYNYFLTNPEIF